jgi:hypothetical protein
MVNMTAYHRGWLTGDSLQIAKRFQESDFVFPLRCQCGASCKAERDEDGYFYPALHVVAGARPIATSS